MEVATLSGRLSTRSGPARPGRIRVEDVSLNYHGRAGETLALDRIELTIEPRELVCLVGPSGCGKTSLLRLLAGVIHPTTGRITLDGSPIQDPGPDRGLVLQQPTLFPWLTARQNVELGPRILGVGRRERRATAESYLELVGLLEAADHAIWELSGGMQQRCAIARALATEPAILLMDEPFGALDEFTRERLQLELTRIWSATGKTIVFVTHSIEEAVVLGSRVVVLGSRPGRVVDDLEVDLPWPRSRTSEALTRVRRSVSARLAGSENPDDTT